MSLPAEFQPLVRFGEFQLDLEAGELRNNGSKSSLQGQPLQILSLLLENPGRVVTREELKKELWPSDTFVDFDQSLNRAVNRLREALGDSAEQPRFVETLPRRGYRFIAPVAKDEPNVDPGLSTAHQSPITLNLISRDVAAPITAPTSHPPTRRPEWNRRIIAIFIFTILFLISVALFFRQQLVHNRDVSANNLEITKLTDNGKVQNVAISPDGRYVAYSVFLREKQELRLRQVATRERRANTSPDPATSLD